MSRHSRPRPHHGRSSSVAVASGATTAIVADSLTTFLQKISGLHQQAALRLQLQLREAQETFFYHLISAGHVMPSGKR